MDADEFTLLMQNFKHEIIYMVSELDSLKFTVISLLEKPILVKEQV